MIRLNLIKRLPKKPLLGLAVLAVALVVAGGAAARRADAAGTYNILVSWESVQWTAIDDGGADHDAEVYGTLQANSYSTSQVVKRKMGNDGKGTCTSAWYGIDGRCNKKVNVGTPYGFLNTGLSSSTAPNQPASNYTQANNSFKVQAYAQQATGTAGFFFYANLSDYDAISANDGICQAFGFFNFTDAQLQTLNTMKFLTGSYSQSDGTCEVGIRLQRIP